jgi:protein-disulfide isomerase
MDKRFGAILLAVVVLIGGVFFFTRKDSSTSDYSQGATSNHTTGEGTANVELVEYGDFQCPACSSFFQIVEQVRDTYGDKIKFTFRNFPLVSIHKNAMASHRAAEAAAAQGKFFEMYEMLYQNQSSWSSLSSPVALFESYASALNLDLSKFKSDFVSEATNDVINADIAEGKNKYKVDSTPTFVLNGQKLDSSEIGSLELFSKKIDEAITTSSTP